MKVKMMQVGAIGTNCYILEDEETGKAAVIDPGDEAGAIANVLEEDKADVEYILLTHGHYDHTTGVPELKRRFPAAKVYIHRADANGAGSQLFPLAGQVKDLNYYKEGDTLTLGSLTILVMETPGHSPGSVTLQVGDVLFTGDTLFCGSCGRTDLRGGQLRPDHGLPQAAGEAGGGLPCLPRPRPYLHPGAGAAVQPLPAGGHGPLARYICPPRACSRSRRSFRPNR